MIDAATGCGACPKDQVPWNVEGNRFYCMPFWISDAHAKGQREENGKYVKKHPLSGRDMSYGDIGGISCIPDSVKSVVAGKCAGSKPRVCVKRAVGTDRSVLLEGRTQR